MAEGLRNLKPGRSGKIFLHFDEPFWVPGHGNMPLVWSKQEKEEGKKRNDWKTSIHFLHEIDGVRDVLCAWIHGEAAVWMEKIADQDLIQGFSEILRNFSGDPAISTPDRIIRHRWLEDPLTMGAWSHPSVRTNHWDYDEIQKPLPNSDNPRLLLAGEHTHPRFWATMHGARLSGIEQADKIVKYIKS
eukprot:TRINITY_DN15319_c0_g1_i2.p1 TRINITY_DN15319_c0_g1~~TRINITY_DN15319_c0_g1_i2.p1  ORF type:complete len:207 (-),score=22.72 TRINITY_DN15319_c0_g1_i2:84-647(-)